MHIIDRAGIDDKTVKLVSDRVGVSERDLTLFLDDAINAVRADHARAKLAEYRQKGWKPVYGWELDAMGENDYHACTVNRHTIVSQKLPGYVIKAIGDSPLLVYLDATHTKGAGMTFVLTLAHELHHAWQYFNAPIIFHSQTALSWVMNPQETPCELDAEKAGKRVLFEIHGAASARAYLEKELAHCKPEHRDVLVRLVALDPIADPESEHQTVRLLEEHAEEIRQHQVANNFTMVGVPELVQLLRGRSSVRLRL